MPQTNSSVTYKTKQKTIILDYLKSNKNLHLTIDEICIALKNNNTPVGTSTVYRQIQKLVDEGIVTKYSIDSESGSCYQYNDENKKMHFHLKCTECSELFHASCTFMESVDDHIFSHHGFKVDNSRTVFYGICQNCLRKRKKV